MSGRFAGHIAVVTGAARGIGATVARRLAAEGAFVVLADLSDQAQDVAREIVADGGRAAAYKMDVTSPQSIETVLDAVEQDAGGLADMAVTCAGVLKIYDFLDLPKETWDFTLAVNLTGTFLVFQAVARRLVKAGQKGKLVGISSVAGRSGRPNVVDYAASKAGVISVVRSAALALAKHGINVNAVCPGVVDTPMTRQIHSGRAELAGITVQESLNQMLSTIPLGRIQTTDDVADVVLFLLSDAAGYVTGQAINADGGLEMD